MRNKSSVATAVAILVHSFAGAADAATVPAAGYAYMRTVLSEATEGCVANGPGGVYVGVGPQLFVFPPPAQTRQILFVPDVGSSRVVATNFNSLSDCVYDAAGDVLYVLDSGAEFTGATTGDTVFAIPGSATNVTANGHELLPSGSISFAFSVDRVSDGLLVSDAAGGGAGKVVHVDLTGMTPVATTWATGFDYTGGLIVDGGRVLVSEAVQPNFDSAIYEYDLDGNLESTFSGPTFSHGSNDLEIAADGGVIATGSSTIVSIDAGAAVTPLVTGLDGGTGFAAFGGSVSVNASTGRIDFLASSFSGADDDKSIHRLVPLDRLVTRGSKASDCAMEFYGVELVPSSEGRPARSAICVDGEECDADGAADGACTYSLGLCFNVTDSRLPDCTPTGIASVTLVRENPEGMGASALVADAAGAVPVGSPTCLYGEGVRLPLREGSEPGQYRRSKGRVQIRATTTGSPSATDTDAIRLECQPALP
jgi:hypothetical protein